MVRVTGQSYFERIDTQRFRATQHVGGAWDPAEQHVGPSLGLLAHAVEQDRAQRRDDPLLLVRASYDILGTFPMGEVQVAVELLRPGRTIELVEARLSSGGRDVVVLRAWLARAYSTGSLAGTGMESLPRRDGLAAWEPGESWPGGFVRSVEVRREEERPGRAEAWLRPRVVLLAEEQISPTARVLGAVDLANGLTPLISADRAAYPNLDLTAHLARVPSGEWLGMSTTVSIGPEGTGLTHSILHDERGPLGSVAQTLTVRPR